MHILMEPSGNEPVGLLMQLEKPIFKSNVKPCCRILDEDKYADTITVTSMNGDVSCKTREVQAATAVDDRSEADGSVTERIGRQDATSPVEEDEHWAVPFSRPGAASIIVKDSNKLTIQWKASRPLAENVQYSMEYSVETQQVHVTSGRATPEEDAASEFVKPKLWKRVASVNDPWAQICRLRPGRYYAIRVVATPSCNVPSVNVEPPECSSPRVFHTTPSVPGAPQPPQLTSREGTSLKFKWNAPESGGLDILEFCLQIKKMSPANARQNDDVEGFIDAYVGSQRSFRVMMLQPGVKYMARVKAKNKVGDGPWSLHSTFTTAAAVPGAPEPPHYSNVSSTSVSLEWNVPEDNGARIRCYTVKAEDVETGDCRILSSRQWPNCVIKGLKSGVEYNFRIRAENQVGESEWSQASTVRIAPSVPDPPLAVAVTEILTSSVKISWLPPKNTGGAEITNYKGDLMPVSKAACKTMERTWTRVFSGKGTTCTVNNLRPGCTYQFRVRAGNVAGYGMPAPCASVISKPGAPEKPTPSISSREPTTVGVSWKPPDHDGGSRITSYQLQCCKACSSQNDNPALFENVYEGKHLHRDVCGLLPGVQYVFRIQAVNSCGVSGWSQLLKVCTKAGAPAVPLPPIIDESSSNSMTVSWTPPESQGLAITSYTVQLATSDGEGDLTTPGHDDSNLSSSNVQKPTGIADSGSKPEVIHRLAEDGQVGSVRNGQVPSSVLVFADVYSGNRTTCHITDLKPDTSHCIRVRATNRAGNSLWSKYVVHRTGTATPTAPRDLSTEGVSTDSVSLCWSQPAASNGSKVTAYILERLVTRNKKPSWMQECQGPAMSCKVSSLKAGCEYQFRVRARNSVGVGPPSDAVTIVTPAAVPGAPEAPSFAQKTATNIKVKWAPPEKENGAPVKHYRLEMAEHGGAFVEVYSGYATMHKMTGLSAGQQYIFKVQAVNAAGKGDWSKAATVEMALAPPLPPSNVRAVSRVDDEIEGCVHGQSATIDVTWEQMSGMEVNCTAVASFEVEARPSKDCGAQLRMSVVRRAVRVCSCTLRGLLTDMSYVVRVRAVGAQSAGHSKWSESVSLTTGGWKKAWPVAPSESNSSGTHVSPSPRSCRNGTSGVSEGSGHSERRISRTAKRNPLRRPRPRKSLWKVLKSNSMIAVLVTMTVFVLFTLTKW